MKLTGDFLIDIKARITQVVCGCFLIQMALVHPLWWSLHRSFPTIPFFQGMPVISDSWATFMIPTAFAIALLAGLIFPTNNRITLVTLGLGLLLVIFDLNRLQVWSYQWLTIMSILCLSTKWATQKMLLQFSLIALYFWSGFNKLNVHYFDHSFPWFMDAFSFTAKLGQLNWLATITAVMEMAIAFGFCFNKTRKIALIGSISLHLIILLILGPLGHFWNYVVWPWNIAMIILVCLLFKESTFPGIKIFFYSGWASRVLLITWGFLPILNIADYWDEQLSFKMYSGAYSEGIIFGPSIDSKCFPKEVNFFYHRGINDQMEKRFILDDWALTEMGVPPYGSDRTLKQIARQWCSCIEDRENSGLEILSVDRWSRKEKPIKGFSCAELGID